MCQEDAILLSPPYSAFSRAYRPRMLPVSVWNGYLQDAPVILYFHKAGDDYSPGPQKSTVLAAHCQEQRMSPNR
jgi:hypothetical protein